jgi:hypothetical protein
VGEVFFGDYSGIAASGGRVYGIWTEQPPTAQESENKPTAETKAAVEAKKDEKSNPAKEPPKRRGTVVKVGVADFKAASSAADSPR